MKIQNCEVVERKTWKRKDLKSLSSKYLFSGMELRLLSLSLSSQYLFSHSKQTFDGIPEANMEAKYNILSCDFDHS